MHCLRCRGLMVSITLEDVGSTTLRVSGWQCVQCGDVIDAEILANRLCPPQPLRSGARPPGSPLAGRKSKKAHA